MLIRTKYKKKDDNESHKLNNAVRTAYKQRLELKESTTPRILDICVNFTD